MFAVTAQHTDLVVEAHGVLADLILVSAHKAFFDAALQYLAQALQAPVGVVFSTAADVLWVDAHFKSSSSDACKRLYVSIVATSFWGVHVKPLSPGTALVAAASGGGGAGGTAG